MTNSERRDRNIHIGTQVATLLNLKFDKKGECKTTWGTKTREGLGAVITRIVEDSVNQFGGEIVDTKPVGQIVIPNYPTGLGCDGEGWEG